MISSSLGSHSSQRSPRAQQLHDAQRRFSRLQASRLGCARQPTARRLRGMGTSVHPSPTEGDGLLPAGRGWPRVGAAAAWLPGWLPGCPAGRLPSFRLNMSTWSPGWPVGRQPACLPGRAWLCLQVMLGSRSTQHAICWFPSCRIDMLFHRVGLTFNITREWTDKGNPDLKQTRMFH